ncbi:MAG: hypothetical protein PHI18_10545, partial [bacterium]|nr:hypothetical protein [bacterium]
VQEEVATLQKTMAEMDKAWETERDGIMKAYREERGGRIRYADSVNAALEAPLAANEMTAEWLRSIKQNYTDNERKTTPDSPERVRNSIANRLSWSNVPGDARNLLQTYNSNLAAASQARQELTRFTEDIARSSHQPDYSDQKQQLEWRQQGLTSMEAQLAEASKQASWKVHLFLLQLLYAAFRVIVVVWVLGIALQAAWLGVDIAGNVRAIRDRQDTNPPATRDEGGCTDA